MGKEIKFPFKKFGYLMVGSGLHLKGRAQILGSEVTGRAFKLGKIPPK